MDRRREARQRQADRAEARRAARLPHQPSRRAVQHRQRRPQGHTIPKQITAPEVEACTGCHRLTVGSEAGNFTKWTTGAGEDYRSRLTDKGKNDFDLAYYMPPKGDLEARNIHDKAGFAASDFARAVKFLEYCNTSNPTEEQKAKCWYADVPRGAYNQPPVP